MSRGRSCLIALVASCAIVLFLDACSDVQEPVEVVRAFFEAIEAFDIERAQGLVCEEQHLEILSGLESFDNVASLSEAFDVSFEDLEYREKSNDGNVAVVQVTGALRLSFLGQEDVQPIAEEHLVVKMNGHWVICDP